MTILETSQTEDPRVVLDGISWESYEQLLEDVGDGPLRLTYDDGRLEIMSPSGTHEIIKKHVARIIEAYGNELEIAVQGYGSTTFKNHPRLKGLEPDECYYVQHFDDVIGKLDLDPQVDPPPDLAIEIDITTRSVARQPIYAALGVPEIWRYDGTVVTSLHLTPDGNYLPSLKSLAFPNFPMHIVNRLLQISLSTSQPGATRALREWVRTGMLP